MPLGTRAVERPIEPGATGTCLGCGTLVKFQARVKGRMVLCNVYVGDRWDRLEVWHKTCYEEAGLVHGPILRKAPGG